jgi:hypothetical protein
MKRTFISLTPILAALVLALGCSPLNPVNPSASSTPTPSPAPSPTPIVILDDIAARLADPARSDSVTLSELDSKLLHGSVAKWVCGDYRTDTLDGIVASPSIAPSPTTNSYGETFWGGPETAYAVSGDYDKTVTRVYYVDTVTPLSYHVFGYIPYGSDYTDKNIWLNGEFVHYLDPLPKDSFTPGAPRLRVWPNISTHTIEELRVERTSYFTYKGIHAGDNDYFTISDPGSTIDELAAAFGPYGTPIEVTTMNDIIWSDRNHLYFFDNQASAYIHFSDPGSFVNARFFLDKLSDGIFHISSMYIVKS